MHFLILRTLLVFFVISLCAGLLPAPEDALASSAGEVQEARKESSRSVKNIAYFEAGPYWEFDLLRDQVTEGLNCLHVLERVRFPESLHVSPGWNADAAVYVAEARRLMTDPSVDLIISMGTVATKALLDANNQKTPIVSIDVADPVGTGILDPQTGKGAANLVLQYTPDKWQKVFVLFHRALPFTKLGIMYYNSPEGRSYSNVDEAREVARDRGFELVEYAKLDKEESVDSCTAGVQNLINQGVDAMYISALNCFDWTRGDSRKIYEELNRRNIKTFARDGTAQVRRGALMGLSTLDYAPLGNYYAGQIAHLLGLTAADKPVAMAPYNPKITLNLDTARALRLDIPLVLLITADEIFDSSLAPVRNATGAR